MAPGASVTVTATYTITQEDLNAGSVTNTASASTTYGDNTVTSDTDDKTANADQTPALTIAKSITAGGTYDAVGDLVEYSYLITNSGNVVLAGPFTVTDDKIATIAPVDGPLAPGASVTVTATYTITQEDLNAGSVTNTASASTTYGDNTVTSDTDDKTANADQTPALTIAKSITAGGTYDAVGDLVEYSYLITNSGNVVLAGPFTVTDDKIATIAPVDGPLAPGASVTVTATYTITQEDLNAGSVTNTASASTTYGDNTVTSDTDDKTANADQTPALTIAKSITAGGTYDAVGDLVEYSYLITNSGNVVLAGPFTVTDDKIATIAPVDGPLAPGASVTVTATYTITQEDLNAGSVTNTASASTTYGDNTVTSDTDDKTANADQTPALTIAKSITAGGTYDAVGDLVEYSYLITNSGNVVLAGPFTVTDDKIATIAPVDGPLAPGASVTVTATYTITQEDLNAGSVTNTASASTTYGDNTVTSDTDDKTANADQTPALTIAKSITAGGTYDAVGDLVEYSYLITNSGNVVLAGPFTVTDDKIATIAPVDGPLAPGASVTVTATYTITQEDLNAGSVTNTASASTTYGDNTVTSDTDDKTANADQTPALTIAKSITAGGTYDAVGDLVEYSYLITNSGNVVLAGPFTVTDDKIATIAPVDGPLAPGASVTVTATYTITQEDLNAGSVTNTASASTTYGDNTVTSDTDDKTANADQTPALTIAKSITAGGTYDAVGDLVEYSYLITNSGNVVLAGPFTVTDDKIATIAPVDGPLAPGASVTVTATYTITQEDLNAGSVTNTASASTTYGDNTVTSDTDDKTANADQTPALTIAKSITAGGTYDAVGDLVEYSYLITNSGNVVLAGPFTVTDDKIATIAPVDGPLAPGASVTVTATYTITQEDLNAGSVTNTASASTTYGDNTVTSDTDDKTANADQTPALTIAKSITAGGTYDAVGDLVEYSYLITNSGNVVLAGPFTVTDDKIATIAPVDGPLAPGASVTVTATYTITQEDLNAGSVTNTASASTTYGDNTVTSDTDDKTANADQTPALTIAKSITAGGTYDAVGDLVEYSYLITNSGNVVLAGPFTVTDDKIATIAPVDGPLAPGASVTVTATYTITQEDLNAGSVTNTASASTTYGDNTVTSDTDDKTANADQTPALTIAKSITAGGTYDAVGDLVEYSYLITNSGNVVLAGPFTVTDDKIATIAPVDGPLAPGASVTVTATYTITQEDLNAGSVTNTASASTTYGDNTVTSDTDDKTANADQTPALTIAKSITAGGTYDAVGDLVEYSYLITNSGNVVLAGPFTVTDDKIATIAPVDGPLAPGASVTVTATYTITQEDLNAGSVTNTASASTTYGDNTVTSDTDDKTANADQTPALTIAKSITAGGTYDAVGDLVEYSYLITNSGNVVLAGPFTVTDDKIATIAPVDGPLAPGASVTVTATYTITQEDLNAGSVTNTASASTTYGDNTVTSDTDDKTANADQTPALTIAKSITAGGTYDAVGDLVEYSYLITNSGNVVLAGPFTVTDDKIATIAPVDGPLAPGASVTVTATYTITQEDLNAGSVTNTASASTTYGDNTVTSDTDDKTANADQTPALTIAKSITAGGTYDAVGDLVEYSYLITNSGNVVLAGPFTVTDDKIATIAPVDGPLAPGASVTVTATYTITQEDLNAGSVTNTASASTTYGDNTVTSDTDDKTANADQTPALTIAKSITAGGTYDAVGDLVEYSYLITNSGNVVLAGPFTVTDDKIATIAPVDGPLAPGASVTVTATYTITQEDLNAGSVTNTASASTTYGDNTVTSDTDDKTANADQTPALTIAKSITAGGTYDAVGDLVEYSYLITNSGNVVLAGPFTVTDDKIATIAPVDGPLAPGASVTVTATYTITQEDLNAGSVTNTASASTTYGDNTVTSDTDDKTANADQTPALTIAKSITAGGTYDAVGDLVEYSYLITNSGNVVLAGPFTVTDDKIATIAPVDGPLAPGASVTVTATYTITQEDLNAGSVTNTASASTTYGDNTVTSDTDDKTANADQTPALTIAKSITAGGTYDAVGDLVEYSYLITNSGNVVLAGPFTVTDDKIATIAPVDGPLAPGASVTVTATYTITQEDLNAGSVTNTASASTTYGDNTVTSDTDDKTANADQTPALTIAKSITAGGTYDAVGDLVEYSYLITNSGNVVLAGPFTVTDDKIATIAPVDGPLAPGASVTVTATYTITQEDLNAGSVTNTASASTTYGDNTVTSDTDDKTANADQTPALTIAKSITAGGTYDAVGDLVEYSYLITNSGNVVLAGPFTVTDDKIATIAPVDGPLAPGASVTVTATYTITQEDLNAGSVTNTASASTTYGDNTVTSDTDDKTANADQTPALTIAKSITAGGTYDAVGDLVEYSYLITNSGNVVLAGPFTVTDDKIATIAPVDGPLAPGASVTVTATYTITQEDLNAGSVTNTASASTTYGDNTVTSDTDDKTANADQTPALTIAKSITAGGTYDAVGDLVEYSYLITNSGNVVLAGPFTVTDDKIATIAPVDGPLAPGASVTVTATYTITQEDLNAGSVTNTASASTTYGDNTVTSDTDDKTANADQTPALTIAKSITAGGTYDAVGDLVEYSYLITNSGNVVLAGPFTVTDDKIATIAPVDGPLAPGASVTVTATYTITQEDLNAGSVTNTASASTTYGDNTVTSDTDDKTANADQTPALTIAKSITAGGTYDAVGDLVEYSYLITNSGNVVLAGPFTVTDDKIATIAPVDGPLAPGASVTVTATYTITQEDLNAGSVTNTASASTTYGDNTVTSDTDDKTANADQTPALTIAKSITAGGTYDAVGDLVEYSYLITNSGNVVLAGPFTVTDDKIATIAPVDGPLAPGASVTVTATYTITQEDLNAGSVTNTASASTTYGDNTVTSDTDDKTANADQTPALTIAKSITAGGTYDAVGDLVEYSYLITNSGNVVLAGPFTVTDDKIATIAPVDGPLAPGASVTVTATYTITQEDLNAGSVTNTASASTTYGDNTVTSDTDDKTANADQTPALTIAKSITAGGTYDAVGDLVEYSYLITNSGNVVLAGPFTVTDDKIATIAPVDGPLAPGASVTVTATYTITQEDLNAGSVTNTASASTTYGDNTVTSDTDDKTANADQTPALTIAKSITAGGTYDAVGDLVEYSYLITNSGNVVLAGPFTVTDDKIATIAPVDGPLAPGASVTVTATYTITQEDLNAGSVTNTASASTTYGDNTVTSDTDDKTANADQTPALTIAKSITAGGTYDAVGDLVEYSYLITNSGNVVLAGPFTVTDDKIATIAPVDGPLAPGASVTVTATYTITQEDLNAGSVTNTASASTTYGDNTVTSDTDDKTANADQTPALTIAKSITAGGTYDAVGDLVEYSYLITNSGNVVLAGPFTVTDDKIATIAPVDGPLAPGASVTVTATYTITQEDLNAGSVTNTASASTTYGDNTVTSDTDDKTANADQTPALTIAKSITAGGTYDAVGDLVEYSYLITNSGNVVLAGPFTVTDDKIATIAPVDGPLAPGASVTVTATYTITQEDLNAGSVTNTASASTTYGDNTVTSDTDDKTANADQTPALTIAKSITAGGTYDAVGDLVEYSYLITNSGNVVLAGPFTVTDDKIATIAPVDGPLAPGASVTVTATYTITQEDLNAGSVTNTASASTTYGDNTVTSDTDDKTANADQTPALTIAKSITAGGTYDAVGDLVEYSYLITNSGNVVLAGPFTVTDDKIATIAPVDGPLAPGASVTVTATYTITQEDLNAGSVTNTASASTTYGDNTVTSDTDDKTANADQTPALTIAKSITAGGTYDAVGDLVEYSYLITNSGNVVLAGPFTVTDDKIATIAPVDGPLAPGASVTVTATYTITQEDLNAGSVTNTASASTTYGDNTVTSDTDDKTANADQTPALTIAKSITAGGTYDAVGDLVEYSYLITNSGNVVLAGPFTVTDDKIATIAPVDGPLAPGASVTVTATYTITQEDLNAGSVTNTASASTTYGDNTVTSDTDDKTANADQTPALTIAKSITAGGTYDAVGDLVEYSYLITNSGNVVLAGPFTVTDDKIATIAPVDGPLAPGASVTVTATYTITQEDLNAGSVTNTASASTTYGDNTVTSDTDDKTANADQTPALTIAKSITAGGTYDAVGDLVEYSYLITNSGNVVLAGPFTVTDDKIATIAPVDGPLAPGASVTVTATYTITQEDLNAGSVTNTASASTTYGDNTVTSDTDDKTANADQTPALTIAKSITAGGTYDAVGDLVEYSYLITNSGNVVLAGPFTVTDDKIATIAPVDGPLAPGASVTVTATYTITQEDLNAGSVTNTASASTTYGDNTVTSDTDDKTANADQTPALTIAKSITAGGTYDAVGDLVEYSYLITNSGNVVLAGPFTVTDDKIATIAPVDGPLAPGASVTVTATYTITQEDLNAGSVTNTASASTTYGDNTVTSDTDDKTANADQTPALTIAKSITAGGTYDAVGDLVEYSYLITNSGNVVLAGPFTVTDDKIATIAPVDGPLAPGASVTVTATYTITQEDLNAGSVTNTASASTTYGDNTVTSDTDDKTANADQTPALTIAKSITAGGTYDAVGDLVEYSYLITNSGNVVLAGPFTVTDDKIATIAPVDGPLAPGASVTVTATYTITQEDLNAGSVTNTASASTTYGDNTVTSDTDDKTANADQTPALTIAKSITAGGTYDAVGDLVEYSYLITNSGNVVLAGPFTVTDDKIATIAPVDGPLAPGASVTVTATYTITQEDLNAGSVTNTASASTTYGDNTVTSDTDDKTANADQTPALTIAKSITAGGTYDAVGDLVEYSYLITNSGNVVLAGPFTVTDDKIATIAPVDGPLAPGASVTVTATYTITQEDLNAGSVTNTASASTTYGDNTVTSDTDDKTANADQTPALTIAKSITAGGTYDAVGDLVEYSYLITNSGNVVLAGPFTVTDDKIATIAPVDGPLAPGASVTVTATYTITQEDLNAGSVTNTASASTTYGDNTVTSDTDDKTANADQTPALTIAKSITAGGTYDAVGDLVEYSYLITNSGNVVLAGPFTVTDDKIATIAPVDGPLAPGASVTVTATYTITQEDLNAGSVTNTASASTTYGDNTVTSDTDDKTANADQTPALTIAKSITAGGTYDAVGDLVEYSYLITNSGNVVLAGPFTVTDDKIATIAPVDGPLAPGASVTVTATYTITQEDLNAGSVTNTASASTTYGDNTVTSDTDDKTANADQTPALTIAKSITAGGTYDAVGDLVEYSYLITNSGNVVLAGPFTVTDDKIATIAPVDGPLAPGASVTVTATYTITQEDLNAGSVTNTASASTTYGDNTVTSDTDDKTANADQTPALTIAKSITAGGTYDAVGDLVEYSYLITNSGNVVLAGPFTVTDDKIATIAPVDGPLAPGASVTVTATYTITQEDLNAGSVTNTASASTTYGDNTVTSDTDDKTANADQTPALTIAKSITAGGTYDAVGDLVEYSYLITNSGNVVLAGPFTVTDDKIATIAPVDGPLAPGASVTVTATYTITQEDLNAGSVTNTASASTTYGDNTVTSDTDDKTANADQTPALTIAKSITAGGTYDAVGDLVEYSYLITNSGNVVLAGPFTVTDDKIATIAPVDGPLAPGASVTVTATYTITQEDLNAGSVTNTASASTTYGDNTVTSDTDDKTANADQTPALTIAKSITAGGTYDAVGDLVEYSYLITNSGNVVLAGPFTVTDDKIATIAPVDGPLAPGASVTVTATYTITQEDLNAGSVTNTASASTTYGDNTVTSDTDDKTANADQTPALTIAKSITAGGTYDAVGDLVEYSYLITNSGNVVLAGPFTVTDDKIATIAPVDGPLAPGASVTVTATYTITQEDLNAGSVTNTASASTTYGDNTVTSDTDDKTANADQTPALTIAKSITAGGTYDAVGDLVEYSYLITNSGNVVLAGPFTVTDDKIATIAPVDGPLAPGASVTVTATYTITQEDLNAGSVTNTASASTTYGDNTVTSDTDDKTANADQTPALTIAKSITAGGTYDAVGDLVEYSYLITNSGNVVLAGPFTVTDDKIATIAPVDGPLAPGASVTVTATYTITQEDLNAGSVTNTASASTTYGDNTVTSDTDDKTANADQTPALTIAKSITAGGTYDAVGDLVEYSYLITNSGNVVLAGPFTVTDDKIATIAPVDGPLAPGASVTVTATYTITQEDLNAGSVTNTASASTTYGDNTVTSDTDDKTANADQTPALTIAKSITAGGTYDAVGDLVEYSYLITNSGNVVLAGPFTVTDDKIATIAPVDGPLAPGASVTVTATYTITQEDLNAGSVTNTASASTTYGDNTVTSDTDDKTANADQTPALTIAKSITAGGTYDAVGDLVEYSYLITNSGNVVLAGPFTVTDDKIATIAPVDGPLAPGASVTVTATYTITQEDLNAGSVTNTASASTTYGDNTVTSDTDDKTANADQTPALTIAKSITAGGTYDAVGDLVEYSYLITSGNVVLAGPFTVTDDKIATIAPVDGPLAPGASVTVTATYTLPRRSECGQRDQHGFCQHDLRRQYRYLRHRR
ncbi:DUF7507 domain-containing protein [Algoriphagus hitonicola]|uniref:DUF7507 domain-containing protein n=1 Tax=Algoriphagus hitonicola TaxID=435880 RepID=UPI003609E63C